MLLAPSILSANFAHLQADIDMLNHSQADWIHVDVMDGVFVPNISFGFPVLQAVKPLTTKPLDVHLMIVQPERYLEQFQQAGAQYLTVQYEACPHLHRVLEQIKGLGMQAGVALNPHTPVALLEDVAYMLDMVLVMSVNPGFGGQKFIPHSLDKIDATKELLLRKNSTALIEVDGGINRQNAPLITAAGADVLVMGSAIFGAEDPVKEMERVKNGEVKE